MKRKADKFDLRLRMVKHALAYGVKPTARVFDTTAKTVRKWLRRYQQERLAGLNELPRIPLTCPHKTSALMERKVVHLRKRYPFMGPKRLNPTGNPELVTYGFDIAEEKKGLYRIVRYRPRIDANL